MTNIKQSLVLKYHYEKIIAGCDKYFNIKETVFPVSTDQIMLVEDLDWSNYCALSSADEVFLMKRINDFTASKNFGSCLQGGSIELGGVFYPRLTSGWGDVFLRDVIRTWTKPTENNQVYLRHPNFELAIEIAVEGHEGIIFGLDEFQRANFGQPYNYVAV